MSDFEAAYRANVGYVWKSLGRLGVQGAEREDLAHDVFVTAFKGWARYDRSKPAAPWLFGIAFRTVADHRKRHRTRFEEPHEAPDTVDPAHAPDEALARRQGLALAAQALDSLELDRRAVFVMHEIDGHGMPDIAEALDVPLNTAYSRLRLARRDFNDFAERLRRQEPSLG